MLGYDSLEVEIWEVTVDPVEAVELVVAKVDVVVTGADVVARGDVVLTGADVVVTGSELVLGDVVGSVVDNVVSKVVSELIRLDDVTGSDEDGPRLVVESIKLVLTPTLLAELERELLLVDKVEVTA